MIPKTEPASSGIQIHQGRYFSFIPETRSVRISGVESNNIWINPAGQYLFRRIADQPSTPPRSAYVVVAVAAVANSTLSKGP
jgi:hypothetical protein